MWPKVINYQFRGDLNSTEYFFFGTAEVCNAIALFDMLCNSVQVGTSDIVYGIHPKSVPLGYGEELQKYYDPGMSEYVPYPTEFRNGYPIYKTREEWDTIPMIKETV
jgi:hypothetical protein